MRTAGLLGLALALSLFSGACGGGPAQAPTEPAAAPEQDAATCASVGEVQFICDLISPEDLAVVPGADWVIASGDQEGGRMQLVSVRDKTATVLFPTASAGERLDAATYPSCPGPLPDEGDDFRAHGLYLTPGQGDVHTLHVVHHGSRESIEVFEVDAGETPVLTWVGCAVAPDGLGLNSVVALPEGGFATTSFATGDVWEWHTDTGWAQIPGSEGSAANGIEISADGRWLYIAGWAEEKLTRLSRGQTPTQTDVIDLGFRPDNLRMSLDGSTIFAAGHTDKDGNAIAEPREPLTETSNVAAIDPETLEVERIWVHPAMDGFVAATTAMEIGNEMWLGSYRGERIAYFPAPE